LQGVEIVKQTQTKIQQLLPRSLWTTLDFLLQQQIEMVEVYL
jgi:hypothetical protein